MTRHLSTYVGLVHRCETTLADSLRQVGDGHRRDTDVYSLCHSRAAVHQACAERVDSLAERLGEERDDEPERLHADALKAAREGGVGLLRDLQDVHALATLLETSWTVLEQAAKGARDEELQQVADDSLQEVRRTLQWLLTHIKVSAPQPLLIGP